MKKLLFNSIIFVFPLFIFSQNNKRNNVWMLGYKPSINDTVCGISFNGGSPQPFLSFRPMSFFWTDASICDTNGFLLMYSNGNYVANGRDSIMLGSSGFNPGYENLRCPKGYGFPQTILFLPRPDFADQYVIIHESADTFSIQGRISNNDRPLSLRFSIVDMALDNGWGGFTSVKNEVIINDTLAGGHITACRHANGRDWWVIAHKLYSDLYYKILVTPDSILIYDSQNIGYINNFFEGDFGVSVFSPNGEQFVNVDLPNILNILHFDRCTGELNRPTTIFLPDSINNVTQGCAFSPSGRYLYVCNMYQVFQLDMFANDIASSLSLVASWDSTGVGPLATNFHFMTLAPDNKIYICVYGPANVLHVISDPDSAGTSCHVLQHILTLPQKYNSSSCLPNLVNFSLGALAGSSCDSLSIGVNEINSRNDNILIFPNPANTRVSIKFEDETFEKTSLEIYNSIDQKVFSRSIHQPSDLLNIDIHTLPNGFYSCKLINGNNERLIGKLSVAH